MRLSEAILVGTTDDLAASLAAGADPNSPGMGVPPLIAATSMGSTAKVKLLLAAGAAVDGRDSNGNTALYQALARGHTEIAKRIIGSGADVNLDCDCGPPLATVVLYSAIHMFELLISAGADVNRQNADGFTPLMLAAGNGVPEAVPVLLRFGAALDLRDRNGLTAYLHAALAGDRVIAEALLRAGADPRAVDCDGNDAALLAARHGSERG